MRALPGRRLAAALITTVAVGGFASAADAAPSITVEKPADLAATGNQVVVKGKGFSTQPAPGPPPANRPANGVYIGVTRPNPNPADSGQFQSFIWIDPTITQPNATGTRVPMNSDGSFEVTLKDVAATFGVGENATDCRVRACGVTTVRSQGNADRSQDTFRPLNFRSETSVEAKSGNVDWGFSASFRRYIEGPIANGTITPDGVATRNADGTFDFPFVSGSVDPASGRTFVQTAGSVTFTGHVGQLNTTISDVRVISDGADRRLIADVETNPQAGGTREVYEDVDLAELDAAATPLRSATQASWRAVASKVTEAGASAAGYPAGTALDPVTFYASSVVEPALTAPVMSPAPAPQPQPAPPAPAPPAAATPPVAAASPTRSAPRPTVSRTTLTPDRLRFRVSAGSTVTARIQRQVTRRVRSKGKTRTVRRWVAVRTLEATKRNAGWVTLKPRISKAGLYRITLRATSAQGREGRATVSTKRVTQAQLRKARRSAKR